MGADGLPAEAGTPASPAAPHTGGASLGLGLVLLSGVWCIRATPVGRPDVLGVGACAGNVIPAAPNASAATRTRACDGRIDSSSNAVPMAIHVATNNVMAI